MATGTVKWFNRKRGFGFIEPDGGDADAFVHITAVKRAGLQTLNDGQRVNFEMAPLDDGRMAADTLVVLDEPMGAICGPLPVDNRADSLHS